MFNFTRRIPETMVSKLNSKAELDACLKDNTLVAVNISGENMPCWPMNESFNAFVKEFPTIKFVKVNMLENLAIAESLGVSSTLMRPSPLPNQIFTFFNNGEEVTGIMLFRSTKEEELKASLDKLAEA